MQLQQVSSQTHVSNISEGNPGYYSGRFVFVWPSLRNVELRNTDRMWESEKLVMVLCFYWICNQTWFWSSGLPPKPFTARYRNWCYSLLVSSQSPVTLHVVPPNYSGWLFFFRITLADSLIKRENAWQRNRRQSWAPESSDVCAHHTGSALIHVCNTRLDWQVNVSSYPRCFQVTHLHETIEVWGGAGCIALLSRINLKLQGNWFSSCMDTHVWYLI